MKRTLLVLSLITLTATFSQAQYNTKTRIMIYGEGGINLSTFYQSASTEKALKLGNIGKPMVGVYVKAKFPTLFGFDAGISASQQGSNTKDSVASAALFPDSAISKAVMNYVYGYWDGLYFFELAGNNSIHAGVGVYAGYALNGDQVTGSDKKKLNFDDWKRLDVGVQLKTAFNLHEWLTLGVQYRISFLRTLETVDKVGNDNNLRNSVLSLTAALRLFEVKSK